MAKKRRRPARAPVPTVDYTDADGNVLTLRESVSAGTVAKLAERAGGAAASADDLWRRRTEMLFERFAVRWVIAGLPLERQQELLARYRMADQETQRWVRETIDAHLQRHQPELGPSS
ncbi:MAG TPA: hypothetical protein VFB51_00255 [Solirubrobacterales bacterium]|nr:hypothetical protein [Solirubrobacterales bacterium]